MRLDMKRVALFAMVLSAGLAFADGPDDALVTFATRGPDRYADGTPVMDGECYALVWSADGVFEGLAANGAPVDSNDRVVLVAPVAENGRCPEVLFQIPASLAKQLAGGVYSVMLLDTRVAKANGQAAPRGTVAGRLATLNGYGAVTEGLKLAAGASGQLSSGANAEVSDGQVAATGAAAPAGVAQPRIKHIRIDGDNVFLTVENLPGFMRVQGGTTVAANDSTGAAVETNGGSNDVILVTPRTGNSGFFRVIRN